jgi:putative chitinase
MLLTKEHLNAIMPRCDAALWVAPINAATQRFEINTPTRLAAFLAQLAHESSETTRLSEGLSYSKVEYLQKAWPTRFPTPASAAPYLNQPQKLANFVYAGRGSNGNPASGDGYRYRGRGLFQLTSRDNYRLAGKALNLPLVDNPDLVLQPEVAALTAAHFWQSLGLNMLADHQPGDDDVKDFEKISIRINGGRNGLPERKKYWAQAKTVLGVT